MSESQNPQSEEADSSIEQAAGVQAPSNVPNGAAGMPSGRSSSGRIYQIEEEPADSVSYGTTSLLGIDYLLLWLFTIDYII